MYVTTLILCSYIANISYSYPVTNTTQVAKLVISYVASDILLKAGWSELLSVNESTITWSPGPDKLEGLMPSAAVN